MEMPVKIKDEELMYRVSLGQLSFAAPLFERHYKALFNFFFDCTHDRLSSEEMTHMVFERMLVYRQTYNKEGSFLRWFYAIARNVRYDNERKIRKLIRPMEASKIEELVIADQEAPETTEYQKILDKFMDSELNEEDRNILMMGKVVGMSYREVAEALNLTEQIVKMRMYRMIGKLKKYYKKSKAYET